MANTFMLPEIERMMESIMTPTHETLSATILAIMYIGDVVFAVSGALNAARHRMGVLFFLIGTITGIGGGTTRDLLMGRTVWWTQRLKRNEVMEQWNVGEKRSGVLELWMEKNRVPRE